MRIALGSIFSFLSILFLTIPGKSQTCTGSLGNPIVNITFGSGSANPGPALPNGITTMQYINNTCPSDGQYTIANYTTGCFSAHWVTATDHTGDPDGYFMLINASYPPSDFYVDTINNLCNGTTYYFGSWVMNMDYFVTPLILPNITFTIETLNGAILQTYNTGDVPEVNTPLWVQYGFYFTMPAGISTVVLRMHNNAPGGSGNDLAIDDITFRPAGPNIALNIAGQQNTTTTLCSTATTPLTFSAVVDSCYLTTAYQWQLSTDNGNTWNDIPGATNTSYLRNPTAAGTYLYRIVVAQAGNIQLDNCRVLSAPIMVNVVQTPVISLGTVNNPACMTANGTIQIRGLQPNSAYAVNYTINGISQPASLMVADANGYITFSNLSNGVYDNINMTINGCTSNNLGPVTLVGHTLPPVVNNITYCQYQPPTPLTATGNDLLWYTAPSGGVGNATAPIPSTTVADTTAYYVTQTMNGCESDRALITVIVNIKPSAPAVTDTTFCQGGISSKLTANGLLLLWYTSATAGAGTINAPLPQTTVPDTTIWYVSQTINSCESNRSPLQVIVATKPTASFNSLTRDYVCQDDTMSFYSSGNTQNAYRYQWGITPSGSTIIDNGQNNVVIRFDSSGYNKVYLTVSNGQCTTTTSQVIYVMPKPGAEIIIKPQLCISQPAALTIYHDNADSETVYHTSMGNATIVNSTDSIYGMYTVKWNKPGAYVLSVTIDSKQCPEQIILDTVTVHDLPAAIIKPVSDPHICTGDTIRLSADNADVTNKYEWSPNRIFSNATGTETNAEIDTVTMIKLQVTSAYSCIAEDSMLIATFPCCEVYMPTAFTPNQDGHNDIFRILTTGHHKVSDFRIVNRWGQTVFETLNENEGWNGTFNGNPQDIGTYYYFIKYQCSDQKFYEKKGEVTLIR